MSVCTPTITLQRTFALALGVATTLLGPSSAQAQTLGVASDYNIFVFESHSASNLDVQGKVAVGGNTTYTNYNIASQHPILTLADRGLVTLIVGGNYTNSSTQVNGSIVVGGNISHNNPSINGNVSANGSVDFSGTGGTVDGNIKYGTTYLEPSYDINGAFSTTQGTTSLPINFASVQADLTSKAAQWGALTPTATATSAFNQLTFNAAATGLTVINITADQWQGATSGSHYTGSANSTLLINITNSNSLSSIVFPNTGANFTGGIAMANVLYNVAATDLATINLAGSFYGSLLAPNSTVTAPSGGFNGQLIAKNLNSNGLEFHTFEYGVPRTPGNPPSTYFKGTITSNPVPEPGTLALFAAITPFAIGAIRRRSVKA